VSPARSVRASAEPELVEAEPVEQMPVEAAVAQGAREPVVVPVGVPVPERAALVPEAPLRAARRRCRPTKLPGSRSYRLLHPNQSTVWRYQTGSLSIVQTSERRQGLRSQRQSR